MSNNFTPTRWTPIPNPELSGWCDFPGPCYDPQRKYGDCPPTLLDVLNNRLIPAQDRIWAFCHCIFVPDSAHRLFAVRCVRETPTTDGRFVADLLNDKRSVDALIVSEKYAHSEVNSEDLSFARVAADKIARVLARNADAARSLVPPESGFAEYEAEKAVLNAARAAWATTWAYGCSAGSAAAHESLMATVATHDVATVWAIQLEIARSFLSE